MPRRKIRCKESAYLVRAFRSMPEVSHKCTIRDDGTVDLSESELIKWAIQNEDILNYIGHRGMSSPYTVFDPETRTWKGIDSHLSDKDARRLSEEEIKMNSSNSRTHQNQVRLEEGYEKAEKHLNKYGKEYVLVEDLMKEYDVSSRTVERWVAKSTHYYCKGGKIYEK